jgi:hypothetical protein
MSLLRRIVLLTLTATFALALLPHAAVAAPPATDMWALGAVDMADLAPGKDPTYIISLQLKKKVKLPMKVAVPLPDGVNVVWSGEVFFGDPSLDIASEDAKIVKDGGQNYVVLTMSKSRALQVECTTATDMFVSHGATADVHLYWTAPAIPGKVRLAIVVPTGYKAETTPEDVDVSKAEDGAAYVRSYKKTTEGQEVDLALTMVAGQPTFTGKSAESSASATSSAPASAAATASAPATAPVVAPAPPATSWAFTAVMVVLAGLLVGAVVMLVLAIRKKQS